MFAWLLQSKVSSCKICWNTKFNLHSIVWNVGQSLFGKTDLHWECTISVSLMILFTNIPNWLFEPKKLHCFWCFAKIQNMPLNGITYNGINRLMESNLSKFTSPNFSCMSYLGWSLFAYCYHLVNGIIYGLSITLGHG